VKRSKADIN